jgi:3-hydroxyacyl-[acyl-carrier-protein] dehydratase
MNRIMQEIKQYLSDITEKDSNNVSARFLFPEEFIGFQGHFPEKPVLPGFCKIQAVLVILQEWRKKNVKLKEIVTAKFFSPVSCGEELIFECTETKKDNEKSEIHAYVTSKGKKIAILDLKIITQVSHP